MATSSQLSRKVGITPFVFTEHGLTMLASVLRSDVAIQMNIAIVEAFISLKEFALSYKDISDKLLDMEQKYDRQFADITEALNYLLQKDNEEIDYQERTRIGYKQGD